LKIRFDKHPKNLCAKVYCYTGNTTQYLENHSVRGYWSSMDPLLVFGLADHNSVDSIRVEWLYGQAKTYTSLDANSILDVNFSEDYPSMSISTTKKRYFAENSQIEESINFKHVENNFPDFKFETLLPQKMSANGPFLSVGDVNGDGLEDYYIGGAVGQSGVLHLQDSSGKFKKSNQSTWAKHQNFEDMGSLFFDCDNDGDLDLYVVSGGGGEYKPGAKMLSDRLYINNGKGTFSYDQTSLKSKVNTCGSKVSAYDYDQDGDLDLFVGGRIIPRNYPVPAKNVLWENLNGVFYDATIEKHPQLNRLGLVTDFEWTDINQDGNIDLIIVGEWMNILVFIQEDGEFVDNTEKYFEEDTRGWW